MQSFRYFVAIGVGAAIALSLIEPGAANAPSLPQNGKESSCLEDNQLASQTPALPSNIWSKVHCSLEADNKPLVIETQASANSPKTDSTLQQDSVTTANNQVVSTTTQEKPASVIVEPTKTSFLINQTSSQADNSNLPSQVSIEPKSTVSSEVLPVQNNIKQPTQLPDTQIAQAAPPARNPSTLVPEYLNPSANPLLFPTRSEEVQIKTSQEITLEQAIELARRNNRDLEAARLTLDRARFALQEANASQFPTAGVVLDFSRNDSASARISNRAITDPTLSPFLNQSRVSTSFNGALQLSYDLYTSGVRPATIRAAEIQVRFQELEVEQISEGIRLSVIRAYYNLQEADAQTRISEAAVANAAQILRDTQLQEQAGLGTRFDVLQTQVSLANASQDLTRARSQQRISRRQIVQLLSLAQDADVSAVPTIVEAGTWEPSLEQTIVLALKNRAELEQQLLQRDISEQRRRIALGAVRPQASLTATYNVLGILDDGAGPSQGLALGARLQWNFFDGGAARARARQATTNIAIAETTFASQRDQIRFDVEQAFSQLNANRENIQTASFALQAAEESLRLARLRFNAGVGTNTDVINQLTELTRAQVNRLRAVLDYNRALADLQRAVSNLPDSNLFDLP
ncbi:MAG: TolC family protein [Coleofasciculaceae cyanobacterium]